MLRMTQRLPSRQCGRFLDAWRDFYLRRELGAKIQPSQRAQDQVLTGQEPQANER